jgi:ParB/RepB/Spo0J family partition protein
VSASIEDIPFNLLDQDEYNARKTYFGIPLMAESIAIGGLLENLCVVAKPGGRFAVKAGNRRFRGMKLLVERGTLPADHPVPCKVLPTDGVLESGIENIAREDLRPWEIGEHYLRLSEKGMAQKEIAAAHAKSQQHVSICLRIARDLAPKVIERISRLGASDLPSYIELARLSEIRDLDTFGPDTEKQMVALDTLMGLRKNRHKTNRSGKRKLKSFMIGQLERIEDSDIPAHAMPYVMPLLRFLRGETEELTFPRKKRPVRRKTPTRRVLSRKNDRADQRPETV